MPKTPATINNWLITATNQLKSVEINCYQLDAELILAHCLGCGRTHLHAHPEQIISSDICKNANNLLKKRLQYIPIAYLFGFKEFYGRDFIVNHNVLIPRPESEIIIDFLLKLVQPSHQTLIDVGTGSGCLGITAKLELPRLSVWLSDISLKALNVAEKNADKLSADVKITKSNLLSNFDQSVDVIIANLPYVDKTWEYSPELSHEPKLALFADNHGMTLIFELINQTATKLNHQGLLILEADTRQHSHIIAYAQKHNLTLKKANNYIIAFIKD